MSPSHFWHYQKNCDTLLTNSQISIFCLSRPGEQTYIKRFKSESWQAFCLRRLAVTNLLFNHISSSLTVTPPKIFCYPSHCKLTLWSGSETWKEGFGRFLCLCHWFPTSAGYISLTFGLYTSLLHISPCLDLVNEPKRFQTHVLATLTTALLLASSVHHISSIETPPRTSP